MKQEDAKKIFKTNFIGTEELNSISKINFNIPEKANDINMNFDGIDPDKYLLILGCKTLSDNSVLNVDSFIKKFGYKYDINSICFYNQDWYLKEDFIFNSLTDKWYLIQKNIPDETRGLEPISSYISNLPSAILCVYTFFIWWLLKGETLWANDYIWCSDFDRYGDRIYVGKYLDKDNKERSGFSIHRHLSIKQNYGSIKSI
tara:strand:+ start:35083 stop:35688 length:606 start_codon:yes stop_codon:yes gene_type:complete